jgi:hypothetical protein
MSYSLPVPFGSCVQYMHSINVYVASFKVLARGMTLFSEVENLLQHLKNQYHDVGIAKCGTFLPVENFSELEELLRKDKADFEVGIHVFISVSLGICNVNGFVPFS